MSGIIFTMVLNIISHQARNYTVATPVYEGPLDLLLNLIERSELDITKLSLALVTDQFIEYMHRLQDNAPEEISAFLVIAARLIQIKSETLLPRPPVRDQDEVDDGELLAHQLLIYKRFKEISNWLQVREGIGYHTHLRLAPTHKYEGNLDLNGITLSDLFAAAQTILLLPDQRLTLDTVVKAPRITIREKIAIIADFLKQFKQGTFQQLLPGDYVRLDVVVTFLALLELVKRSLIYTHQDNLFAEISIEPSETWEDDLSFELEFGE